ncbi:MAG: InlB B-repeat-containing protein [Chitinispirillales bacterium]|nr:InlB B-repeat-containing protein [Chitinispirillales bacterium]
MSKKPVFLKVLLVITATVLSALWLFIACSGDSNNNWSSGGHGNNENGAYTLIVVAGDGGTVSLEDTTTHNAGASITVTATPNEGFTFGGWAGMPAGATTSGSSITFNISGDVTLTANFLQVTGTHTLTVTAGVGGTVAPEGTSAHSDGATVTVTAEAEEGYRFTGWTGAPESVDSLNASITFDIDGDITLIANFEEEEEGETHTLTVTAGVGGTVSSEGISTHSAGDTITVTATPNEGYIFSGWSGTPAGAATSGSSITFTINDDVTLIANFEQEEGTFLLTVTAGDGGMVSPAGVSAHSAGASVTVTATPNAGYTFSGWSGTPAGASTSGSSITFTINDNVTLTANFEQEEPATYILTVNASPAACATALTGGGEHNVGVNAPITVTAAANCTFTGWTGATGITNANSTTNASVLMDTAKTVTANFTQQQDGEECGVGHGHFNPDITYGSFIDERDGQCYRTVVIGDQTWMAENLNWAGVGGGLGWCYANNSANCEIYGRLYDWSMVMGFDASCNDISCVSQVHSPHRGICPDGWHVPSDAQWSTLVNFVGAIAGGSSSTAGTRLRALTGWEPFSGTLIPGTDVHGFSALPGGSRNTGGNFWNVGTAGHWWSATEAGATHARDRVMNSSYSYVNTLWPPKTGGFFSLRCVRDD